MGKMKRAAAFILALMVALAAGCSNEREYPAPLVPDDATPPEKGEGEAYFEAELYFVSGDGRKLSAEDRTVRCDEGMSRARAAIEALAAGPQSPSLLPSVPEGLTLERVEISLDVCNVYFSGMADLEPSELLTLRASLAATVSACEGIGAVNVFLNGVETGYLGRPLGESAPIATALDVYIRNMQQEYEVLPAQLSGEAGMYVSHNATLYFADAAGVLLAAQSTPLSYSVLATNVELVKLLLGKLGSGDSGGTSLEPVLPADFTLYSEPEFVRYGLIKDSVIDPAAQNALPEAEGSAMTAPQPNPGDYPYIIDITLEKPSLPFDERLMCAAVTMTLTGFMPGVDGVRVSIKEEGSEAVPLCESFFTRADFFSMVGHMVTLAYPSGDGTVLEPVRRIIPSDSAYDPMARLRALFEGPADPGVMYPAFTADDIASVYVEEGVAVIDWREGFTEKLINVIELAETSLPRDRREICFIYGVINTLAFLPGVSSVWMTEGGENIGTVENIYLGNSLLASPGLMAGEL